MTDAIIRRVLVFLHCRLLPVSMNRRSLEWTRCTGLISGRTLTALLITLGGVQAQAQAPANDAFDSRIPLGTALLSITATNTLATPENGEAHRHSPAVRSLWWRWTAPVDGYVLVATTNSPSRTRVDVYDYHKVLAQLNEIALLTNSGLPTIPDRYEFSASQGTDYNIAVDGRDGESGIIQLDLKVYTKPEILVQPTAATVTAGQRTNISVGALGKLPLTNQWQFGTLSFSTGFTNTVGSDSQLIIGTNGIVSRADQGWYRVVVKNEFGSATSSVVRLDVNECATPTVPLPASVVTNAGKTVLFSSSALGTADFYFQWQFKPLNQGGFVDLAGATSSNLLFTNISTDLAGQYRVLVSNVACTNQASTNVSLTVLTNNSLVLDANLPIDLTRITNENATFSVQVSEGYQPIRYQWWFTPVSGPSIPLNGETAPSLFLSGIQLANAGRYWAVVSNQYNVVTSRLARLNIELRPPNDNFVNRIPIFPLWTNLSTTSPTTTNVIGWNKNASNELGEPQHQPGTNANLSIWWSFTPPTKGHIIAKLTSPDAPQVLAAYTGYYVDGLARVSNLSNWLDRFEFVGADNIEYLFAVDSRSGIYSTNIALSFTFDPNYGGPTITCEPGKDCDKGGGDGGIDFHGLGGLGEGEGCSNFSGFRVVATSIDGAVYYQWQFGPTTNGPFADLAGMTNGTLVIESVTMANQGWYRAATRNNSGAVVNTRAVHLTVDIGPVIATNGQPQSVSAKACDVAQFQVTAMSCGSTNYQWRQNGLNVSVPNILGANASTLLITNLTLINEGCYDVVVWNDHQSVTSTVAMLTLDTTPTLLAEPRSVTNFACETASFLVGATANCALTYQWFFEGTVLSGATGSSLAITNVEPLAAGNYFVVVSTPFASVTSQVAHLTIQTNPVILTQPTAPASVPACNYVNLQVEVQGEPLCSPVTYQWQHSGTNLPPAINQDPTNRTFSFAAQAEKAGDYRVIISNPWASVTSAVANVTVAAQPVIAVQPTDSQRVREGNAFTNQIGAVACGALNYTWQFQPLNGSSFSNVTLDLSHFQTTNGWLVVQNAQTNESGCYRVVLSNIYASVTSSVALIRVVRPPPNDNFVSASSLGTTNPVTATGYNEFATVEPGELAHALQPPSHSVWWVWTNPFPSLVTIDLGGSDIDTLLSVYSGTSLSNLTTVAEDDDGRPDQRSRVSFMAAGGKVFYVAVDGKKQAEGTNLVIAVTASPITSPPIITEEPVSLAATVGQTVTFTNSAYGSPDIAVQWFGNGTPRAGITTNYPAASPTNYFSTLTLPNVTTNDAGVYRAVLSNSYGSVTSRIATLTFGSIVRGLVTDATRTTTDGAAIPVPDALVSIGTNSTTTDKDGNYELVGVQRGELRAGFMANKTRAHLNENVQFWDLSTETAALLTATKTNFYDYLDDQFEVGKGQTVAKQFSMSPIFSGLRFVLNWTKDPGDLDMLLHFPTNVPVSYPWIDYLQQNRGSIAEWPFALRDADMNAGWGPETISIHRFTNGNYSLYVRRYPGQGGASLPQSSARVVAYLGGNVTNGLSTQIKPLGSVTVPTQGTNEWWHVCDIDGLTTNITWVNQLLASAPGGLQDQIVPPNSSGEVGVGGDIGPTVNFLTDVRYAWDFGDGSPLSPETEPVHAYADPGWKTVSLRVTQLVGAPPKIDSVTKTNYLYVENMPPIVAITNPLPNTIFRAGDPITLQSAASGGDDPIQRVDYYLLANQQTNYLGTVSNAPYAFVFPNTNCLDCTNVFAALARDFHGASNWSASVSTTTVDLSGDILILRNFSSAEIDEMVAELLGNLTIHGIAPVVRILDEEGLRFDLVRGFKVIIWSDQGLADGGLTDNDVAVLQQAYDARIPLYLIGDRLGRSRDNLTDIARFQQWTDLLGCQTTGTNVGPVFLRGIKPTFQDELFYGCHPAGEASTGIFYPGQLERLSLTANNLDVVADFPVAGVATNSPAMLRFPRFSEPDFGETRRLIQNFRVTSDQPPQSPEEEQSRIDRKILFVNGTCWLLRLFECQDLNLAVQCNDSGAGIVGQPMTFVTTIGQNGFCTAGGVIFTSQISPRLHVDSAELFPGAGAPTDNYQMTVTNSAVVIRFSRFPRVAYQLVTTATPWVGGWVTNHYTISSGIEEGLPCSQVSLIEGPACDTVHLDGRVDSNRILHLSVSGGVGCVFQVQTSNDLVNWSDSTQIQPDVEPYDIPIASASGASRFYRLLKLE